MLPLPVTTLDPNMLQLARLEREDVTGVASANYTLQQGPVDSYLWIWKNGALLHNIGGADFTVAGATVTFAAALIAGDKVTYIYWTRGS